MSWLRKLAIRVHCQLLKDWLPGSLKLNAAAQMRPHITTTEGWYVQLAKFYRDRTGELQLWLDHYPDAADGYRRLCLCYKSTDVTRLRNLGRAGTRTFGRPFVWTPEYRKISPENFRLAKPLQKDQYDRPIVEIYEDRGDWSYYCIYLSARPATDRDPSRHLVAKLGTSFHEMACAVDGLACGGAREFQQNIKPPVRARHLRRERSSRLSEERKIRDGYICQICKFNFARTYGDVGRGFAEAHHIETLSEQSIGGIIGIDDLLTVCSNCHRMIHRLGGGREAIKRLRKLVGRPGSGAR